MNNPATADIMDTHPELAVVESVFRDYGGAQSFFGPIATLKLHEDNTLVREALAETGNGRVLVVDGGGSLRCALVGDRIGALAVENGWAGIVVYGGVRDARILATQAIGIKALGTCPRKSIKQGVGERELVVQFGGVRFSPGDYLYADEDGIVVSPKPVAP